MSEVGPELVCLSDFEPVAQQKMSHMAWEYINAGAADELTVRWNKEAYQRIRLKPHVLVDVSKLDPRIRRLGKSTLSRSSWPPHPPTS
jgi:4-hydroxymandelate oxidase